MAEIILVRHGKTAGNLEGRYIGSRTDEPLCEEGIHALEEKVRAGYLSASGSGLCKSYDPLQTDCKDPVA